MQTVISVIIACCNGEKTIAQQLEALLAQESTRKWETVFSDNRSTDASADIVRAYQQKMPDLHLVEAFERQGKSHALNKAVSVSRGEYLLFCDADDVVAPGYIQAMGDALDRHGFVAAGFDFEKLNSPHVAASRKNCQKTALQKYGHPPFLVHAGGGSLGVRKTIFDSIGGFSNDYRVLEDTDFCFRAQLAGHALHFVAQATVHVRLRESIKNIYKQQRDYGEFNVKLYKDYRKLGMPSLPWSAGLKGWIRLLLNTPRLRHRHLRLRYLRNWSWKIGRVKGCIKYRIWAL